MPTPITDKSEVRFSSLCNPEDAMWVPSKVARELESENAKLREHVVNLLPYAHMLSSGLRPMAAYADLLAYVIADAESALKP